MSQLKLTKLERLRANVLSQHKQSGHRQEYHTAEIVSILGGIHQILNVYLSSDSIPISMDQLDKLEEVLHENGHIKANDDDLFLFLQRNATELRLNNSAAIQIRYKRIKQEAITYNDFITCTELDLRDKLNKSLVRKSQISDIIRVLRQQRGTVIYQNHMRHAFLSTKEWDYLISRYCQQSNKPHIPLQIIKLCGLFYGKKMYWIIPSSDLSIISKNNKCENWISDVIKGPTATYNGYVIYVNAQFAHNDTDHMNLILHLTFDTKQDETFTITWDIQIEESKTHLYDGCVRSVERGESVKISPRIPSNQNGPISISFDFNKVPQSDYKSLSDTKYEWKINEDILKLMDDNAALKLGDEMEYICKSPTKFGFHDMFHLRIMCSDEKLGLYLYLNHLPLQNGIKIENVNIILVPYDRKQKRKVWRGYESTYLLRYKGWRNFNRVQMIQYLKNHYLSIELKGLSLIV